jgi:hypothetical protein
MSLTITRTERDVLYHSLIVSLTAIGDIHMSLQNDDPDSRCVCGDVLMPSFAFSMISDGTKSSRPGTSS